MSDKPTQLYRHFDRRGRLLYVGISLHAVQRLIKHRERAPWYRSIARVMIQNCPSLSDARAAERAAIIAERPRHNIVHNTSPPVTVPVPIVALHQRIAEQAETIRDLRARLDTEAEERRQTQGQLTAVQAQLTALLTDQRVAPNGADHTSKAAEAPASPAPNGAPTSTWGRFLAWRRGR